jgi:tetratricopeptide (TPR) repeat protein
LGSFQKAMDGLVKAMTLDPRFSAEWIVAACGALDAGLYEPAKNVLAVAWQMESAPASPYRFVGAQTLLGFVHTREFAWDRARQCHQLSLETLRDAQHVYRDVFRTLSACGLGEIELRVGQPDDSLAHFRHAWRLVKEEPRMLGNIRLGIRAQAGMAACYAGLGERDRAEQHLAEAVSRLKTVEPGSSVFQAFLPHLHYAVAVAQLRLGMTAAVITSLSQAIDTGWRDAHWLWVDRAWETLRDRRDYRQVIERVRLIPPITLDLSRVPFPERATSSGGS